MIICPDCRTQLSDPGALICAACGWRGSHIDDVPVFLSSQDRESALFARYLQNYDRIAVDDLEVGIQSEGLQQFFNERMFGYLGNLTDKRVCDVGIGKGILYEKLLSSDAASVTGVDISMPYLSRFVNSEKASVVLANAENLPFRDAFDVVIATDVLEHVMNVGDCLISMREALSTDGRLVIRVPYKDRMLQYARLSGCPYDLVHLRNFAEDNLKHLLSHSGFAVDRLLYDGFDVSRGRPWVMRTPLGRKLFEAFIYRILGPGERLEQLNPHVGRVFMEPILFTALAHRV